jgi:predicted N-acyltransferase
MSLAKTSAGFEVQIAHSVTEFGQAAWDRLGSERPFASYRWYRLGETVLTQDRPIYVLLARDGEPAARATFWLTRDEPLDMGPRLIVGYVLPALMRRWPLLLCRSPLASSSGLILPADPHLRQAALETIAQVAQELAQQHRVSFLVFDYLEREAKEWPWWPQAFIPATIPEPGTHLRVEWPDFESYLNQLSRKRRKHYRQHQKYGSDMGVEIKLHPSVTRVDETLALIRNVEQRYHAPPTYWTRPLLENAGMVDCVWIAAEIDGRLVGCELMVGDRGHWRVMLLGRDYEFEFVYFLLGYADIRYAIESGAQVLHWGTCTYEVKQRLGFELESNEHLVFTARNRGLRWMGRKLAALLE